MCNPLGSSTGAETISERPNFLGSEKHIPTDIIYLILNHCTHKDLLTLECVSRHYSDLTRKRWTTLSVASRLDFDWDFDCPETYHEKAKFRLGKALHFYMDDRKILTKGEATANQAVAILFADIMKRFPFFGAFVYSDLSTFGKIDTPHQLLFEKKITLLQSETTAGGNLVLQSILLSHQITENNPTTLNALYQHFQKAIAVNATCASFYACQLVDPNQFSQFLLDLTKQSIVRSKDYRGLESLLNVNRDLVDELYRQGIWHPPVVYLKAKSTSNSVNAEILYDKSVELYGRDAPGPVLRDAADAKAKLEKWNEAESLYQKAIVAYGDNVPAVVWRFAAYAKVKLKKWNEAESLYEKAIAVYVDNVPVNVWRYAAEAKFQLEKWEQAELMYEKAIAAYGVNVPAEVWRLAAFAKYQLEKWEQAEPLYEKAIAAFGDNVPAAVWRYAADVKAELKKWEQAEALNEKAIAAYGVNVPVYIWQNAVITKLVLKKWIEAEVLFEKTIAYCGDKVPAEIWYYAAYTKIQLKKWIEAEVLFEKTIAYYGDKVPAEIWYYAAYTKIQLNKWKEARIFINKTIAAYGDNVPSELKEIEEEIEAHLQE